MSWSYVGDGTVTNNGAPDNSISISWPGGMTTGDLILIFEKFYNGSATISGPHSSYTALSYPTNFYPAQKLFGKYAGASEPAPDLSFDNGFYRAYIVKVFRWSGGSAPAIGSLVNAGGHTTGNLTQNWPFTALTPTVDDCLCVLFGAVATTETTIGNPPGYTNDVTTVSVNVSGRPIGMVAGHVIQTTKATIASGNTTVTGGTPNYPATTVLALVPGSGGTPTQTISDVNTNDHVVPGVAATIHGSGFGASQGAGTVVLNDGSINTTQSVTAWSDTSITFTVSQGNLPYGSGISLKVTNNSSVLTTLAGVTIDAESGINVVTLGTLRTLSFDPLSVPARLYDSPDMPDGAQVRFRLDGGTSGATFGLDSDGRFFWHESYTAVHWKWWASSTNVWTSEYEWDLHAPFPAATGSIAAQSNIVGHAITDINCASLFSNPDPSGGNSLSFSIHAGTLPAGVTLDSTTGVISGTPTAAGTNSGIVVRATDAVYGDTADLASFTWTVTTPAQVVVFTGPIGSLPATVGQAFLFDLDPYFQFETSYALTGAALPDGLTLSANLITGTPTTVGNVGGIVVTASNAVPSSAATNPFTIEVQGLAAPSRWFNDPNQIAALQKSVGMLTLVDIDLASGMLHLHDGVGTLTFGGNTYQGIGTYGALDAVSEDLSNTAKSVKLTLSGVDPTLVNSAMNERYQGRTVTVYLGLIDVNTLQWYATPEIVWEGRMDFMAIDLSQNSATITVSCEPRLRQEPRVARFTNQDQQLAHPGDNFFDLIWQIPLATANWGAVNVAHPATAPPSVPNPHTATSPYGPPFTGVRQR